MASCNCSGLRWNSSARRETPQARHGNAILPGQRIEVTGVPDVVRADAVRVEQMIGNLLDYAAKSGAGAIRVTVG